MGKVIAKKPKQEGAMVISKQPQGEGTLSSLKPTIKYLDLGRDTILEYMLPIYAMDDNYELPQGQKHVNWSEIGDNNALLRENVPPKSDYQPFYVRQCFSQKRHVSGTETSILPDLVNVSVFPIRE